jgi:hypothetical protein
VVTDPFVNIIIIKNFISPFPIYNIDKCRSSVVAAKTYHDTQT